MLTAPIRRAIPVGVTVLALLLPATSAAATDPPPHPPTAAAVTATQGPLPDGGTRISPTEISYDNGRAILRTGDASAAIGPDCPLSSFCVYDMTNYRSTRLALTGCGFFDLGKYPFYFNDRAESLHFNASGVLWVYDHRGTEHSTDVTLFKLAAYTAKPDLTPYRNITDHLYRQC
ncbi:hypothetical protein [Catellatospora methionotrophica]|uniref:hypothetical protein n=1 Tax=Catellatospora methionotrophica TaxID=121620 RepID=UPI0033CA1502